MSPANSQRRRYHAAPPVARSLSILPAKEEKGARRAHHQIIHSGWSFNSALLLTRYDSIAGHQCDGQNPCYACKKANIECVYCLPPSTSATTTGSSSKQKYLKPKSTKTRKLGDAAQNKDQAGGMTREPRDAILASQVSLRRKEIDPKKNIASTSVDAQDPEQPLPSIESSASQRSFSIGELDNLSDGSVSPHSAPYTPAYIDWPPARVLRVLDNILQWDCVAFCLIDKERFKLDFQTGSRNYCSPVLVDALLALSAIVFRHNIIDEVANRETEKPAWDVFSATLANEAIQVLHRATWLPETMPDIQALGVLALYCACQCWKDESYNFAMNFAKATRKYCTVNTNAVNLLTNSRPNIASTYCGAISMNRLMLQIQKFEEDLREYSPKQSTGSMELEKDSACETQSWTDQLLAPSLANERFVTDPNSPADDIYEVVAELHQLVEQVFKTCCRPAHERTFEEVTATYIRGLEWYQTFFKYSQAYTGREPVILFVHTYYHFCILSLFTPYMMHMTLTGNGGSPPGKICEEAANIILKLMKHHDSLAGDSEPVGFMHSFKKASLDFLNIYSKAR
ncbi:hypothetical protein PWT90_00273 [Aphanocladium album]|nr:hypothetical protein PWT90_00273 [Aphanocladium album]